MALGSGAMTAALQRPIWTLPRTLWSPRPRRVDARQSTRPSPRGVIIEAYAVPGPLYITASFDRDRLSGLTPPRLLPNQSFLQFPSRSKDLRWCSRSLLPPNGPLIALQLALVPSEKFECLRSTRGPASWRHTAPLDHYTRREEEVEPRRAEPPLVRVRLHVHYRVHSRQMLCVAGSAIPFGWSFLSIAKVPMSWAPDDLWGVEVELLPGTKLDYKYVILEEQDWTQQVGRSLGFRGRCHASAGAPAWIAHSGSALVSQEPPLLEVPAAARPARGAVAPCNSPCMPSHIWKSLKGTACLPPRRLAGERGRRGAGAVLIPYGARDLPPGRPAHHQADGHCCLAARPQPPAQRAHGGGAGGAEARGQAGPGPSPPQCRRQRPHRRRLAHRRGAEGVRRASSGSDQVGPAATLHGERCRRQHAAAPGGADGDVGGADAGCRRPPCAGEKGCVGEGGAPAPLCRAKHLVRWAVGRWRRARSPGLPRSR